MEKSYIGTRFNRSIVKKLEIPEGTEDQIKKAFELRFLKYPEDLEDCVILENQDKLTRSIQWNYNGPYDQGESVGYFYDHNTKFKTNEHWSKRMQDIHAKPS
ncbi:hypothetical protein JM79_3255 [Gramella sp. Hel_I_59]|uniref:hypothetical protein n=1 Tax=Gramella sp. Hel_I_59 TaxID=1249978 RepID=UPI001154104B|nr:hypothetical protein [Gramella sp. Hel_I_59]TQI69141.1 hypothetical protein JM79_0008 [Gramella sp. Hel_I_59]TQI72297.1 hypothetical protein JM79_3255 [Gramella sp. Hel_I_59]